MDFRLATMQDLPQLKTVYQDIVCNMNDHQIAIWDDIYPCEFFSEDINNKRLYILLESDEIIAAFALCNTNQGESSIEWKSENHKVLYLDRFGVNVNYLNQGTGTLMLKKAMEEAKRLGAQYLRLFVVDINKPAINLYLKNGFTKAKGYYDEIIDQDLILHEYGFEIALK